MYPPSSDFTVVIQRLVGPTGKASTLILSYSKYSLVSVIMICRRYGRASCVLLKEGNLERKEMSSSMFCEF